MYIKSIENIDARLKCQICISPTIEWKSNDSIEWYFNSSKTKTIANNLIANTEHVLISRDDASLIIYNVQVN